MPMLPGSRIRIFTGADIQGPNGIESRVNHWLEANPLVALQDIKVSAQTATIVVVVIFSGITSS